MADKRTFALFGAAPDTSNRGVSALYRCVVEGIGAALPDGRLLVFDSGRDVREDSEILSSGESFDVRRIGAHGGRRYYARGNLAAMAALSSIGGLPARFHPTLASLDDCSAVLDVSGGDSFSDIYGSGRFWSVIRPKLIAERRGTPLFLLPQTYGPFVSKRKRNVARGAVLAADMAWARDPRSFRALQDLVGADFDPSRHREGVDMAFGLDVRNPGEKLSPTLHEWLADNREHTVLGLNVSGMIALDPAASSKDFSLQADYLTALTRFLETAMEDGDRRLVIVPHVMSRLSSLHSDRAAGLQLVESLPAHLHPRIIVAPRNLDEREVKWLISRTDWFCGTRMHSTIAALSSGVPTATVPYSDKALGVFETCGVGSEVIDPRTLDTATVTDRLLESVANRHRTKEILSATIPTVKGRAAEQFKHITHALAALD